MEFKDRFRTKDKDIFNFIADKHPNIQSAKNRNKVINYVIKDGDYLTYNLDVNSYMKEKEEHMPRQSKGKFYQLAETIKEKIESGNLSLKDLNDDYGELFIKYTDHINKYIRLCKDLKNSNKTEEYYSKIFSSIEWCDFQRYILDIVDNKEIDNRKVNWFYDSRGGRGKSTIANYLEMYKDAYIITGGKQADIYRHYDNNKIVIYDLPRDYVETNESIYATMECFKNGYVLDTKFEGSKKRFIPPHILVFSNQMPNMDKLSKDRWNIVNLETFKYDGRKYGDENSQEVIETNKEDIKDDNVDIDGDLNDIEEMECECDIPIDRQQLRRVKKNDYKDGAVYYDSYRWDAKVQKFYDLNCNRYLNIDVNNV